MKVGEICNREVVFARKRDNLLEASKKMREHHVGSLVVVEEEGNKRIPVGILTDRDILIEVASEGVTLDKIGVEDVMVSDLVTASENADVDEVIKEMHRRGIRRIPVVDDAENLVGILTMDDILEFLTEEIQDLSRIFSREVQIEARLRS